MGALTSTDGVNWSGATVTVRGVSYAVGFEPAGCAGPCLTLSTLESSPTVFRGVLNECGCDYSVFWFGDPAVCSGSAAPGGPCSNVLAVRIDRGCCPVSGWGGAGWYCVRESGSDGPCAAAELADADRCDPAIEICSGPFADEATAAALCA